MYHPVIQSMSHSLPTLASGKVRLLYVTKSKTVENGRDVPQSNRRQLINITADQPPLSLVCYATRRCQISRADAQKKYFLMMNPLLSCSIKDQSCSCNIRIFCNPHPLLSHHSKQERTSLEIVKHNFRHAISR